MWDCDGLIDAKRKASRVCCAVNFVCDRVCQWCALCAEMVVGIDGVKVVPYGV